MSARRTFSHPSKTATLETRGTAFAQQEAMQPSEGLRLWALLGPQVTEPDALLLLIIMAVVLANSGQPPGIENATRAFSYSPPRVADTDMSKRHTYHPKYSAPSSSATQFDSKRASVHASVAKGQLQRSSSQNARDSRYSVWSSAQRHNFPSIPLGSSRMSQYGSTTITRTPSTSKRTLANESPNTQRIESKIPRIQPNFLRDSTPEPEDTDESSFVRSASEASDYSTLSLDSISSSFTSLSVTLPSVSPPPSKSNAPESTTTESVLNIPTSRLPRPVSSTTLNITSQSDAVIPSRPDSVASVRSNRSDNSTNTVTMGKEDRKSSEQSINVSFHVISTSSLLTFLRNALSLAHWALNLSLVRQSYNLKQITKSRRVAH